jgi:hypothetical protein
VLRSQRILLFLTLLVLAVLLHTMLCEWHYKVRAQGVTKVIADDGAILAVQHGMQMFNTIGRGGAPGPARPALVYTGLFRQRDSMSLAIIFGVVAPIALLVGNIYLLLGWRHQDRLRRGLCPKCKYNLEAGASGTTAKCPECGWQRP